MICSSVILDRFIPPSLPWGGLQLLLEEFQGVTSVAAPHEARARIALLEVLGRRSAYTAMADKHEHPQPEIRDRRSSGPGAILGVNHRMSQKTPQNRVHTSQNTTQKYCQIGVSQDPLIRLYADVQSRTARTPGARCPRNSTPTSPLMPTPAPASAG
jgi:hypothetical protein